MRPSPIALVREGSIVFHIFVLVLGDDGGPRTLGKGGHGGEIGGWGSTGLNIEASTTVQLRGVSGDMDGWA